VRGVAGQQHPTDPVRVGQPGGVAEAGQPARGVHAEVGSGDGAQLCSEVLKGRRVTGVRGGDDDAVGPGPRRPDHEPPVGHANLGHRGGDLLRRHPNFQLAHERPGPRRLAGEADAEQLAHRAARAVAADDVARAQPFPAGQLDGHPVVVLVEAGHRTPAPDLRAQAGRVFLEQADDDRLRDAQQVGVRGVQAGGRGFVDGGEEAARRTLPSVFEHALEQPAHRHHFDAPDVQTDDAGERRRLGVLVQDKDPHVVQPQLGGQHRTGRTATGNDHVVHVGVAFRECPAGGAPQNRASWPSPGARRDCGVRAPSRGRTNGTSSSATGGLPPVRAHSDGPRMIPRRARARRITR
jgi:hypothetical protein